MEALCGGAGVWGWNWEICRKKVEQCPSRSTKSFDSLVPACYRFPLKQAAVSASLALAGDTFAQLAKRFGNETASKRHKALGPSDESDNDIGKNVLGAILQEHDWLRALRMTSYGFLLYGPGSFAWYQFLDTCMPKQSMRNLIVKVFLNQVVLGPSVIAVVFAWNNLWQGKLSELLGKYRKDALPTLINGFKFWIPMSIINFWLMPLQARVAFMSTCSIFWNFYLSSTMSK